MAVIPGLRSPYVKVGRVVYFARMLDKMRLHAAGKLPAEYVANLGDRTPGMFDTRCCAFLRIRYDDLKQAVLGQSLSDDQALAWAEERGGRRTDEECTVWNGFMIKRGWRDEAAARLATRNQENGFDGAKVLTMFDYIDYDEGRDPVAQRSWESV